MSTDPRPQRGPQNFSTFLSGSANASVPARFYDFDEFRIDVQRRTLLRRGVPVPIKPKALDTLVLLVEHRDRVVDKDELMNRLWPDTAVEEANLTQNIFVVRKALGEAPGQQRFIATFARRGYRFVEDVSENSAESQTETHAIPVAVSPGRVQGSARIWAGALLLGLAIAGLMFGFRSAQSSAGPIRSIAVVPLRSFSADPAERYFAEGMTDALIADLARISALRVTSRQSVMRFADSPHSLPEIARALGVDALIEGSVGRSGGRIRLNVNLVDGRTDQHLWTAPYDRPAGDILAVQGELAHAVANAVRVSLTVPEETALLRRRPVDPEAYDLYLRGRHFFNLRTQEAVWKSLDLYQQAVDRDPTFADAHAAIALSSVLTGEFRPSPEVVSRVRIAAKRALELDPNQVDAQVALAAPSGFLDRRPADVARDLERILDRNPNHVTAHLWFGTLLEAQGRLEDALVERRRAVALDPLSPIANLSLGGTLALLGRFDEAINSLHRALEIQPDYPDARGWLGWIYLESGRQAEGLAELEASARPGDQPRLIARYAHALGLVGRSDEARQLLHVLEQDARERFIPPLFFAHVHAGLQERDVAFAELEEAYRQGPQTLVRIKVDPLLRPLHDDPRFESLVKRLGLPWP